MLQLNNLIYRINNTLNFSNRGWIDAEDIETSALLRLCENTWLKAINHNKQIYRVISGTHKEKIIKISKNYFGSNPCIKEKYNQQIASVFIKNNMLYFEKNKAKLILPLDLPKGTYQINYPDRQRMFLPHKYFLSKNGSKFASTWFPIVNKNKFGKIYLHLGTYSNGCLTVDFKSDNKNIWDKLYLYLIRSTFDETTLGTLHKLD